MRSTLLLVGVLALAGAVAEAADATANLLSNSGFEGAYEGDLFLEGWNTEQRPMPGYLGADYAVARSGKSSLRLSVDQAAKLSWYQARQELPMLRPGRTVTLSVYICTADIRDGIGAYCSINCFDNRGVRIGVFDSETHFSGSSGEWRRQSATATIPDNTKTTVAIFTLYGHGTAWFDDAQLEMGDRPTPYQPSGADRLFEARGDLDREHARRFWQAHKLAAGAKGCVGILKDSLPAHGAASSPDRLSDWLAQAGYQVVFLNAEELANPLIMRGPRNPGDGGAHFDLVILPYGATFPAAASTVFQKFLRQCGGFLSTGGYAFDVLLTQYDGRWHQFEELPMPDAADATELRLEELDPAAWSVGSDPGAEPPVLATVETDLARQGLEFRVRSLSRWATTVSPAISDRLPAEWSITRFRAKGGPGTNRMILEWHEKDGSRWKTTVDLGTQWKEYALTRDDFAYWPDNPSKGRGWQGDHLHPESVAHLLIGVAGDIVKGGVSHSFQLAKLSLQPDPLAEKRRKPDCMNTRYARIRDAMWPTPEQITVFDPSHDLRWVAEVRSAEGQRALTRSISRTGKHEGYAAVGMTSNQGHGFGPDRARLVPILNCYDRFGRFRGPAASVMLNFAGCYAGSAWAFFGVTNRDVFDPEAPDSKSLLLDTVRFLLQHSRLFNTDSEFTCYRAGDTAKLRTSVTNWTGAPRKLRVRFERLADEAGTVGECEIRVQPWSVSEAAIECPVDAPGAGRLRRFTALLLDEGRIIDEEEAAFFVWEEPAAGESAPIAASNAYFCKNDRPRFLMGSQTYWGQNGSVGARSPLNFERDFAMMRDYGFRFTRQFVRLNSDYDWRQSDAMVGLARRHGMVFYHSSCLYIGGADDVLAEQAKTAARLARRYQAVTDLMVDVCNEPRVQLQDAEQYKQAFNAFLQEKYGTTQALRKAWGDGSVELGSVVPKPLSKEWDDMRCYDTHFFSVAAQKRWAENSRSAVRNVDPGRLVSVGFMQDFGDGHQLWAPRLASRNLDFTDRHYYGPLHRFPPLIKDMDCRSQGKPFIVGECGAVNHPTYLEMDPWGNGADDAGFNHRFVYLVHHTFGLGVAGLLSWHWRDPMQGIFPFGLVHADRVARPAASIMRALAITFGRLRPTWRQPEVMLVTPDTHRLGGQRDAVVNAVHRAEEILMSAHVDFALIGEWELERLPAGIKALVYPVPYCPPDETVRLLKAFAVRGGWVYVSGDVSYDPTRALTRAERLETLCGVKRLGENYPNVLRHKGKPVRPSPESELLFEDELRPAVSVQPLDVEVLTRGEDGRAVLTQKRTGFGGVVFCADPIELSNELKPCHVGLYRWFLDRAAKVSRNPLSPDEPFLRRFHIPLVNAGGAEVLFNHGSEPCRAKLPDLDVEVDLAASGAGLVVVDARGRLLEVECQGEVLRCGRPVCRISGHAILVSLDGQDIPRSNAVLILPLKQGAVSIAQRDGFKAELGEFRRLRWHTLEPLPVSDSGEVRFDEEQALNMAILYKGEESLLQARREAESIVREW